MIYNLDTLKKFTESYYYKIYVIGLTAPQGMAPMVDAYEFSFYLHSHAQKYILRFILRQYNGEQTVDIRLDEVDAFPKVNSGLIYKKIKNADDKAVTFTETTLDEVAFKYHADPDSTVDVLDCDIFCVTLCDRPYSAGVYGNDEYFEDTTVKKFNELLSKF